MTKTPASASECAAPTQSASRPYTSSLCTKASLHGHVHPGRVTCTTQQLCTPAGPQKGLGAPWGPTRREYGAHMGCVLVHRTARGIHVSSIIFLPGHACKHWQRFFQALHATTCTQPLVCSLFQQCADNLPCYAFPPCRVAVKPECDDGNHNNAAIPQPSMCVCKGWWQHLCDMHAGFAHNRTGA